jgi:rfaE bifunctional protein kinase chain/domain
MIDRYLTGNVSRISPEAPVPVVLHKDTEDRLGGAANVALNIHALGGIPLLCSVVGADADGAIFNRLLPEFGMHNAGIVASEERVTTVKTRILGNNQQMLRIDKEHDNDLSATERQHLLEKIIQLLDHYPVEVMILQDYNKGVLSESLIEAVLAESRKRNIPVAVDPKKRNFFAYKGVFLFKPNLKEIRDSAPFAVSPVKDDLQKASDFLKEKLDNSWTMITLSERGLFLDTEGASGGTIYPTIARNVADVSGAGDTVISVAALGIAAGFSAPQIALLSNLAGGQVCEMPGVVAVDAALLEKEWQEAGGE